MTCETIQPLLSEFADERLDVGTAWELQVHLAGCESCAKISRDIRAMRSLLQTLPTREPSAQFDTRLAQRLAMTRRPERRVNWQDRWLRPALALGAAAAAVGGFLLLAPQSGPSVISPDAARSTDRSLVSACIQQHRSEAAAEPLGDLSAQTLAVQIETSPAALSANLPAADVPL